MNSSIITLIAVVVQTVFIVLKLFGATDANWFIVCGIAIFFTAYTLFVSGISAGIVNAFKIMEKEHDLEQEISHHFDVEKTEEEAPKYNNEGTSAFNKVMRKE